MPGLKDNSAEVTGAEAASIADIETAVEGMEADVALIVTDVDNIAAAIGTPASDAPTKRVQIGVKAETTVPTEGTDGKTIDPWNDSRGRAVNPAHDLSSGSDLVTPVNAALRNTYGPEVLTALTAVGQTSARDFRKYGSVQYEVVVASLEAGQRAGYKIECSSDGVTNWGNADADAREFFATANGVYPVWATGRTGFWWRLNFTTDSTGGAVTLTPTVTAA